MTQAIRKIVIVGGGTAGWMAAAALSRFFSEHYPVAIEVVDSASIDSVGVGEATLPGIRDFLIYLGLDEVDFIRKTQATFKLGIEFRGWNKSGEHFFHPFANFGTKLNNVEFHHYVYKLLSEGKGEGEGQEQDFANYTLPAVMAKLGRFAQPQPNPPSPLADYHYAYHLDASLFANYLREFSMASGVTHRDALVQSVNLKEKGLIDSLALDNGENLSADLFIDCSGFKGLLIEQALESGYEDWSHWLRCNSAIAVQSEILGEPSSYTAAQARDAGWQWSIPLQNRMGHGYVYCDDFIDEEEATHTLLKNIRANTLGEPRLLKFTSGRRKRVWNKNCVALGLAAGFLEPLESTSISLIQTGLFRLLQYFPHKGFNETDIAEVNRQSKIEAERIRDFLILHYKSSSRQAGAFWQNCRDSSIPESLNHKINLFKSRGQIINYEGESFTEASWLAMYNGFNIQPAQYDIRADLIPSRDVAQNLMEMRKAIRSAAERALSHSEFIQRHCQAG